MKPALKKTWSTLACVAGLLVGVVDASAKLEWETKELHNSASAYDKELRVRFHFVNKGDKPVTILWLRSSCGCVVPKVRDQVVAPGQPGEIEAVFDLDARQGKQKRAITVHTDDPDERKIGLFFYTDLPEVLKPSKSLITWPEGESGTQTITVETNESVPVQELVALTKDPNLDIKIEPSGPSKTYTVAITPKPNTQKVSAKVNLQAKIADSNYKISALTVVYR